jgi:MoxR-like ATPase
VIHGDDATWWLDGESAPIHDANEADSIAITAENAADYVRFFCFFLRADEGGFVIVEDPAEIGTRRFADDAELQKAAETDESAKELWERLQAVRKGIAPVPVTAATEGDRFFLTAAVLYGNARFATPFAVAADGMIEMLDDEPVATLDGLTYPLAVPLGIELKQWPQREADLSVPDEEKSEIARPAANDEETAFLERWRKDVGATPGLPPTDKEITEGVVAVLLEEAIRKAHGGSMVLQDFNSETSADDPIAALARYVHRAAPTIIIESDIPFVESFVGGLLAQEVTELKGRRQHHARAMDSDEGRCQLQTDLGAATYFISFTAYRALADAERVAHELAISESTVLIGADRAADVPDPLRRLCDEVLSLPRLDRRTFARVFERVFNARPAPGWEADGSDWTRYLVHADFHGARRFSLKPERAIAYLRERVLTRLQMISAQGGPSLSELHGVGEAGRVAEDLIADIRAAVAGTIPWTAVDRGLLLVGKPGTGKTSLARAIAKEAGIKFVSASATGWQSAGALDSHLRAMRQDFREARRFSPAILFIDEIDSIGNREKLEGGNAIYQTDVVNALLEQMQALDTESPVIVMAATNYAENVDPALRRAGRLDQVVRIPLPNIDGLERILEHYLAPYRERDEVAPSVTPRQAAELALGTTGADVEFFVRGAARRARREGRRIEQTDLVAEVTRRPRRPDSAPMLGREEMRRVAVHEAGHATASLTASRAGSELTFVTIVPRLDGSLGFVASLPREGSSPTRRDMLEDLEKILAGRAAEEIVYGAADVSLGAGGPSESSDLAVATRLATMLVCQSALGSDMALHWTRTPTRAQEKQITKLLQSSYEAILGRLQIQRRLLDEVVSLLVKKQEIAGSELRILAGALTVVQAKQQPASAGRAAAKRSQRGGHGP